MKNLTHLTGIRRESKVNSLSRISRGAGLVSSTLIGLTVLLLLGIALSNVQSGHRVCGSTVSGQIVSDSDLNCVGSNGVTVGANNSTSNPRDQGFGPPGAGTFFDLADRDAGAENKRNKNNPCDAQSTGTPAGVCSTGE